MIFKHNNAASNEFLYLGARSNIRQHESIALKSITDAPINANVYWHDGDTTNSHGSLVTASHRFIGSKIPNLM